MAFTAKTFSFSVDTPRVEEREGPDFDLHTQIRLPDTTSSEFLDLCDTQDLRVGLKIFESHSRSPLRGEFRAVEMTASGREDRVRVRFSIPRSLFADQQCRIAQIDLLYEGKLWFEQAVGAPPHLPVWVERPAKEVDVFDHYFKNYGKR